MREKAFKYDAVLLLASCIWGFAFVAQKAGMEHIGPFLFNGIRFALGSFVLIPFILWLRKPFLNRKSIFKNRRFIFPGIIAGLLVFGGASLQQIGIVYTTAGKAGFITGLYVIIVPIMGLIWKEKTNFLTWIGSFLAILGLYFLTVKGDFSVNKGDFIVLLGAFIWAGHVHFEVFSFNEPF